MGRCIKCNGELTKWGCQPCRRKVSLLWAQSHRKRKIWQDMLRRCNDPNSTAYNYYGDRGIKVCPQWYSFEIFDRDTGERPSPTHTLDRIDNDGDYCPENIRWATIEEQNSNRRTCNYFEYKGEKHTLAQWARKLGIHEATLRSRVYDSKWSIEDALSKPLMKQKSHSGVN